MSWAVLLPEATSARICDFQSSAGSPIARSSVRGRSRARVPPALTRSAGAHVNGTFPRSPSVYVFRFFSSRTPGVHVNGTFARSPGVYVFRTFTSTPNFSCSPGFCVIVSFYARLSDPHMIDIFARSSSARLIDFDARSASAHEFDTCSRTSGICVFRFFCFLVYGGPT